MTQQEQIALLTDALQEVGKMPEWVEERGGSLAIVETKFLGNDATVFTDEAVLACLAGVAYSHCAINHLAICRVLDLWELFDGKKSTTFSTEAEALAAAVRVAGKGGKQ